MELKDWQAFWKGHVIIMIEGKAPEKFINLALAQGISLWDIIPLGEQRFMAKVAIDQVKSLRPVARVTKTRFRIRERRGFPFALRRVRRRKTFAAGVLMFILLLYGLSSVVWFVDYSSAEELERLDAKELLQLAGDLGLRPGVLKGSLDTKEIERNLEVEIPNLAWAGVELQGTRVIIRVVEKKLPTEEQLDRKPGHLVAAKDGVISELLVISGQPLIEIGDTVTEGQVLVSGIAIPGLEEGDMGFFRQPRLVRARGVIKARVWYEGHGEVPLVETGERLTGKEATTFRLLILDKQIILKGPGTPSFKYYQEKEIKHKLANWRNWQLPVELLKTSYHETEPFRRELGLKEAQEIALKKAFMEIEQQLPANSRILHRRELVGEAPAGRVHMRVIIEAVEEITQFVPLDFRL